VRPVLNPLSLPCNELGPSILTRNDALSFHDGPFYTLSHSPTAILSSFFFNHISFPIRCVGVSYETFYGEEPVRLRGPASGTRSGAFPSAWKASPTPPFLQVEVRLFQVNSSKHSVACAEIFGHVSLSPGAVPSPLPRFPG